ncbi:MAG TPA: hydroxyacylglutathione hydrolase [Usitatibacter sp.]|nr:hydroxyacylglutathione hydrolase [Usitatibacter sp.]
MLAIHGVPAFEDNYLWVMARGRDAAVVDPGDAGPVEEYLAANRLTLRAILATHHHGDHVGGLAALAAHWKCPVFGPAGESIAGLTRKLREGERITVPGLEAAFEVLDVPGHTAGHIAYWHPDVQDPFVFCGDTLFAGGCGRLFEGTAAQMVESLAKLGSLHPRTRVYCAHEYTLANLRFARAVEPENAALAERQAREAARRERGEPTVPSSIGVELQTNPFLRWDAPAVIAAAEARAGHPLPDRVAVFAAIREWKNRF